ncbi:MAG: DNA polymerase III subunit gamma/tau [Candidatus Liptonbacteria bacterium]|nr:DNA polymerase III subunit gamma/tau [Candidatus Liptonbacteria bacterium]
MPLAIYRKYRPKTFKELIGQEPIIEILQNAAKNDKIGHAYLFYGPRGSGKTTLARIMAKVVNCETRDSDNQFKKKGEPCNKCRPCLEIDEGKALDVIEIDAASNRGIDEIRNLKEGIRLSPTSYKYKVFIIDECHQLTKEASNALLKTLEEPPSHAIFILATTEFEKIPTTIISRTQRFNFKKLSKNKILQKLKNVVEVEKIKIDEISLELIATAAEGSFRDAESLLDQVILLGNGDLSTVEQILGKIGFSKTAELAGLILKGELEESLEFLSKINEGGYNLIQLNHDIIHYLRRVLVLSFDPKMEKIFEEELTLEELKQLKEHSKICQPEKHIILLKSLIRAYSEMKYSPFAIIPLEVAIIENLK